MAICPYCGERAAFRVEEVFYESRELTLQACCAENLSGWIDSLACCSKKERAEWIFRETGLHVRDVVTTHEVVSWTLDYGLRLESISFAEARDFIRQHHRHCAPPVGWRYGAAVYNGDERIGVMTAGRPVSAELARQGCMEVNRVCVKERSPRELTENACSMLYGYACREAFKRGCERVVTYTLASERGTSLRAAGFSPVARSRGGSWDRRERSRTDKSSTAPKVRWERWRKQPALPVQLALPLAA